MISIVHIDYTTIQNKQNSRRFLCIIDKFQHNAQKTSVLSCIFVQNRKSYNSVTLMTKGYRTVTKELQVPGFLLAPLALSQVMVSLIYYIRVKELQKELQKELRLGAAFSPYLELHCRCRSCALPLSSYKI